MALDRDSQESFEEPADNEPLDLDQARKLVMGLSPDSPPAEQLYARYGVDKDTVFAMINPALERLVRQVERTFEHYSVTMGRESISAIYVSTAMDVYRPIIDYIGGQLAIESDVLDPLDPGHEFVNGMKSESTISERSAFVPVLGVALSDMSRTLNLICTSEDKEKKRRYDWTSKIIVATFLTVMIVIFGYYLWLSSIVDQKRQSVAALEQKLAQHTEVSEATIMKMVSAAKTEKKSFEEIKEKYLGVTILGEIARITPESIRLFSVQNALATSVTIKGKNVAQAPQATIDGVVSGAAETLDSTLAGYVLKLQSSPLFGRALITTKKTEKKDGKDMLYFTLSVEMNEA
jgi:hypothetical protein